MKYRIDSSVVIAPASAAAIEINPTESRTIVKLDLDTNATLNIGAAAKSVPGDELIVKVSSDTTARSLTPGTGMTGAAISGVISKTKTQLFVYDGDSFIAVGASAQID